MTMRGSAVRMLVLSVVLAMAAISVAGEETWVFTTLAGVPPGAADGVGTAARFYDPFGVAFDANGNLFVAEVGNATIRKITPTGVVSTFAGAPGERDAIDGPLNVARFITPRDLAFDKAGNLYVADAAASSIRKITPGGVVSTFAGTSGEFGSTDGTGPDARFMMPVGLAIDSDGNLFVVDEFDQTIRKITPAGVVTTFAGKSEVSGYQDGAGSEARFDGPVGITIDASNNLYVTDVYNFVIRKVSPGGVVTTFVGNPGAPGDQDGTGSEAQFLTPVGIDIDPAGNLLVSDSATMRKVTPAGVVTTIAGTSGARGNADGTGAAASFVLLYGLATDAQGNAFVCDGYNHTIRKVSGSGVVTTFAGRASIGSDDGGPGTARFFDPRDVEVDASGNVFVADYINHTIRKITPGGLVSTVAGSPGAAGFDNGPGSEARFFFPLGLGLAATGELYVSERGGQTIRKITPGGTVSLFAGAPGEGGSADGTGSAARFGTPNGTAVDSAGNVFVADEEYHTIRRITPAGAVTTFAGSPGERGSADGVGTEAQFDGPSGLTVSGDGKIFVCDRGNSTIRELQQDGTVTTIAGTAGEWGTDDGSGADARFDYPQGIGVDAAGNLFVSEWAAVIRRIDGARNVTTVAGEWYASGSQNGAGSDARFNLPMGVDIDAKGVVYVADSGSNTIRRGVRCETGALCTLDGRFQLSLSARDPRSGNTGAGVPLQQNDLFGFFSIPALTGNAGNPEVFVKMLDGQGVNGKFWVFYGGLTDFEYTLTVKDTQTGTTKSYKKDGGTSNGGFDVGGGVAAETCAGEIDGASLAPVTPQPCSADGDSLCLNAGRFGIELSARDPRTGNTGEGLTIPQSDLFGYFALPALTGSASNPEVFVKVLDGRPVNGYYWIFFSGLTDLEYTMTVTDTQTGKKKSYTKAGGSACGAFDINAFE